MLDLLRPLIEAEAAQQGRQKLELIRTAQMRNKLLWALFSAATLAAFCIILASVWLGEQRGSLWTWCGVLVALVLITCSERLRHDPRFVGRQVGNVRRVALAVRLRNRADFLNLHAWVTYLLVAAPFVFTFLWTAWRSSGISRPGTAAYAAFADELKQLSALAGALLAAQIALFNFMFSQLLGKYSSAIAVAVSEHRAVRLLRGYSVGLLVLVYLAYFLGFPDAMPRVTAVLAVSLAASVVITVWVGNSGIRVDRAILYAGRHSAMQLRRSLKPPILKLSWFWKAMAALALDWRSPERVVVTVPPEGASAKGTSLLTGIFNAAHKSIQENQHEALLSSLQALLRLVDTWVDCRKPYFGSTDPLLSYVNDQLAGVLKAAARSPNEYMVMNTVTFIGFIGMRALDVGRGPDPRRPNYPESHPYYSHWQGLLSESFELTHVLMRSTAATEAITQLTNLAKAAVDLGYIENVSLNFPAEMKRLYTICLLKRDAYHISLSGECVTAMMNVWGYCVAKRKVRFSGVTNQMSKAVQEMALAFQAVERLGSVNLEDPITSIVSKSKERQFTLQDIALFLLSGPITEDWQRREAVASLRQLLGTVSELTKDAAKRDVAFANDYAEVLYEFAVMILSGIPESWNPRGQHVGRGIRPGTVHELFDQDLGQILIELIPLYYRAEKMVYDWEQPLFGVIGMGAAVFAETGRESAKVSAVGAISAYRDLLAADQTDHEKIVHDDSWDYLQLASVWLRNLLQEPGLADGVVEMVANGRPFHFGMFALTGKQGWGVYGYPNVSIVNSDFFLPNPRNIHASLNKPVWEAMKRWQDRLMNPNDLQDTYERIERIREPIRERLIAQRERARQGRQPARPVDEPTAE